MLYFSFFTSQNKVIAMTLKIRKVTLAVSSFLLCLMSRVIVITARPWLSLRLSHTPSAATQRTLVVRILMLTCWRCHLLFIRAVLSLRGFMFFRNRVPQAPYAPSVHLARIWLPSHPKSFTGDPAMLRKSIARCKIYYVKSMYPSINLDYLQKR